MAKVNKLRYTLLDISKVDPKYRGINTVYVHLIIMSRRLGIGGIKR